ncbi:hypothetical protein CAI21_16965 [Alkalilimnicola ehrlichii]|uniref:Regulatory protein RecX n=1 Tax=Alkalilimnicola ehrlichii TaxID=351052 RepID=A0A3E0WNB9_9GAMM|nr:regulatory protein RecX [Alkalilimnicola ehrlichii]RFA26382.1 hypothetical protein CAI21_16965 [Alkalilimnicola ehrlichii]RFA33445.1 hypothetical protein CAL65_17450 [Alkalilimnicola ehrlichii]
MVEPTLTEARELGIRLLARREHSVRELRRKMRARELPDAVIEEALAQLQAERLLSDERFAEEFARSRRSQGYGPVRIVAELRERGVEKKPSELTETDEEVWAGLAAAARLKRFGPGAPETIRERNRQFRFLSNRGFTAEQIRQAFTAAASGEDVNFNE